jgi:hypothetical protein
MTKTVHGNNDEDRKGNKESSSFFRSVDGIRRKFSQENLEEDFLLRLESSGRKIISGMIVIGSKTLSSFLVIRSPLCWVYCARIRGRTVR